jgi:alkylated DNA repair dioxygenase AlkB
MTALQGDLLAAGAPAVHPEVAWRRVDLDATAWVEVAAGWLTGADELFAALAAGVPWRHGRRRMYDRMVDDPRLSRWYHADETPPHALLDVAREALRARYRVPFAAVGLNFYRDGADSVAFHRDRELRELDNTLIAILTLGAARPFRLRPLGGGPSHHLLPASGDLLVMGGSAQAGWEHAVPKVAACGPRISASWRWTAGGRSPAGAVAR